MNLKEIAKDYNDAFGFNIIPLEDKVPKFEWKKYHTEEMNRNVIEGLNWNSKTNGIGAISGINEFRCLDFDNVKNEEIVFKFAETLGLGKEYNWIVKSGSGKGYHIWFKCNDDDNYLVAFGGEKSYYKFNLREAGACDHIELRWKDCQTVLPPSLHPSGKKYEFVNLIDNGLPVDEPGNVWIGKLLEAIKTFCEMGAANERATYENNHEGVNEKLSDSTALRRDRELKEYEKRLLKNAANYLKGKIDNYDDWLRIGFALASLGEKGRKYFIKISKDNSKYPKDTEASLNKKFDSLLKDYTGEITLGSFFDIAKKYGWIKPVKQFWKIQNNKAEIGKADLIELLEEEGFGKILVEKSPLYIKVNNNVVSDVNNVIIKDYVLNYVQEKINKGWVKKLVKEKVITSAKTIFSDATLECLHTLNLDFVKDTKEKSYFFYDNCLVEVTKTKIIGKPYNELKGFIWERQKVNRKFRRGNTDTVFVKFLMNICRKDTKRLYALSSAIGYLLHRYKNPTVTKAIIFIDEKLSENAFGRSGKGVVAKAINQIRSLVTEDGRNFRFDNTFAFQKVNLDTEILFFDDVNKKFQFERLFSIITEGIDVEKKNRNKFHISFEDSPKILISTNYSVQGSDDSSKDRQFVIEFSDYYNEKHKPTDDFGKQFFNEWDEEEFRKFDNFMIECCQLFLREGLREYDYVNLTKKKLIDETCPEFEEFIKDVELGTEYNKKNLFNRFKETYEDYAKMRQNTFTKWTKVYANLYNLDVHERKSGADRFISLTKSAGK